MTDKNSYSAVPAVYMRRFGRSLDSYWRALLGAKSREHADRVIMSQVECLGWTEQRNKSGAAIKQLPSKSSVVVNTLGSLDVEIGTKSINISMAIPADILLKHR